MSRRATFPMAGLCALLGGIVMSLANGTLYAWPVFMLPLEAATGWTRMETSATFTLILLFFSLGMCSGGFILTRIGPLRAAALGGGMLSAGLCLAAGTESLWMLYLAYGVVAGYGIGLANVVPTAVCLRWFPKRRGLVCGVLALFFAQGTLLFGTGLAGSLIPEFGVRATMRILGVVVLAFVIPGSVLLRYPPQPQTLESSMTTGQNARQMLTSATYWSIWAWALAVQLGGLMIAGHIVPYAVESGISAEEAALVMGGYALANAVGRLVFGYAFDAAGAVKSLLGTVLTMGTGLLLLAFLPGVFGHAGVLLAVVAIAMAYGGTIPQFSALIVVFFGTRHMNVNIGFSAISLMAAALLGPPLGGALRMATGGYSIAILVAACTAFAGVLPLMYLSKKVEAGRQ